jgi:hypothetical protein
MKSAPLTSPATDPANPAPGELAPKKKFLDQCRDVARYRQLAYRTEECYLRWIRQFILHHQKRHPVEMGPEEIREFLTYPMCSTGRAWRCAARWIW